MGSSRWDVVVGLKYSKWSLANQTSVVLFLDCRQFCIAKNIWGSPFVGLANRAPHMYIMYSCSHQVQLYSCTDGVQLYR